MKYLAISLLFLAGCEPDLKTQKQTFAHYCIVHHGTMWVIKKDVGYRIICEDGTTIFQDFE